MLIVHGVYHWRRQVVAFRNDFCLNCELPRVAFRHRTFDVLHVFWLPVIPLGFWRRWHCQACGRNPHVTTRTRKGFKWAGVVVLAVVTVAFWVVPPHQMGDTVAIWGVRIAALIGTVWALRAAVKSRAPLRLEEHLRRIQPNEDKTCPMCHAELYQAPDGRRCIRCGIQRQVLPAG